MFLDVLSNLGINLMNKHEDEDYEWTMNSRYLNDYEFILLSKLRVTTWNDVTNEMLWIIRLIKENYELDFIILQYFEFISCLRRY